MGRDWIIGKIGREKEIFSREIGRRKGVGGTEGRRREGERGGRRKSIS